MKKYLFLSLAASAAGILALAMPVIASAQTLIDTGAATDIGATVDSGPATGSGQTLRDTLKAKLQAEVDSHMKAIQDNEDQRNAVLGNHPDASSTAKEKLAAWQASTSAARGDIRDQRIASTTGIRADARMLMKEASSTAERWGIRRDARLDDFKARQSAFVKQLQLSLSNLVQIRGRIAARIDTEAANGRDMTIAKSLLAIADQKIAAAQAAVTATAVYVPTASSTVPTDPSAVIDLGQPRQIGSDTIKAVNDVRQALQQVVIAIAHSLGFKIGLDGRIVATSTAEIESSSSSSTQ